MGKHNEGRCPPCESTFSTYDDDEAELIAAMARYQKANGRRFPSFSEVLAVAKSLGYRKVAEAGPVPRYVARPAKEGDQ